MKNLQKITDDEINFVFDQPTIYGNLLLDYAKSVYQAIETYARKKEF